MDDSLFFSVIVKTDNRKLKAKKCEDKHKNK